MKGTSISAPKRAQAPRAARQRAVVVKAHKVAVLGAAGGIGQPLSLLLKMHPGVTELHLYDVANVRGVAEDLSHIDTRAHVRSFLGPDELDACLHGCKLVVIPAGVPRKPGMTRQDLFNVNAGIVSGLAEACARNCPDAVLNIISNPVNSTVPIVSEVLKKAGVYNPAKVVGVTTLDVVRANTFTAEARRLHPVEMEVPVIGGHAGITILPLLSQAKPKVSFSDEELDELVFKIQEAGTTVVERKEGKGSATLSMAYAALRMAEACIKGFDGLPNSECAFVASSVVPGLPYFASKVTMGKNGVEKVFPIGEINDWEKKALENLKPMLLDNINAGIEFAKGGAVKA